MNLRKTFVNLFSVIDFEGYLSSHENEIQLIYQVFWAKKNYIYGGIPRSLTIASSSY